MNRQRLIPTGCVALVAVMMGMTQVSEYALLIEAESGFARSKRES